MGWEIWMNSVSPGMGPALMLLTPPPSPLGYCIALLSVRLRPWWWGERQKTQVRLFMLMGKCGEVFENTAR